MITIITNVIELSYSITFVSNFADRLRHARNLTGMTQAALAKACGLSQGAIANYEGKSRQVAKEIFRLADALGVNALWLKHGLGPMMPIATIPAQPDDTRLEESKANAAKAAWPFETITSDQFWALPAKKRTLIEKTVAALIASLPES